MREIESAFFALKTLREYPTTSLGLRLLEKTREVAYQISSRNVSSIFLSAAKLKQAAIPSTYKYRFSRYYDTDLFELLATESMKPDKLADFISLHCGTVIYSIGSLQRGFQNNMSPLHLDRLNLFFPSELRFVDALVHRILDARDEAGMANTNIGNLIYGMSMVSYKYSHFTAGMDRAFSEGTRRSWLD